MTLPKAFFGATSATVVSAPAPTALVVSVKGDVVKVKSPCHLSACPGGDGAERWNSSVWCDAATHAGDRKTDGCVCGHKMHKKPCPWCKALGEWCPRGARR